MPPSAKAQPPKASNRCPRCAYQLDGIPGIPSEAYLPTLADLDCPECGLHIPMGSCCVVGASSSALATSGLGTGIPLSGARVAAYGAVLLALPVVMIISVLLVLQIFAVGPVVSQGIWAIVMNPSTWSFSLIGIGFGVGIPLVMLLRRWHVSRSLNTEGGMGGADLRLLVEPGALRVFVGAPTDAGAECAAADVQRIAASSSWSFFPKSGAPKTMSLFVNLAPGAMGKWKVGIVFGHFLIPAGAVPMDVARRLWWCLHAAPASGAVLPTAVTKPTPSVPPVCPQCAAQLEVTQDTTGAWRDPTSGAVACARCALRIPAGSYVLNGWIKNPGLRKKAVLAKWPLWLVMSLAVLAPLAVGIAAPRAMFGGQGNQMPLIVIFAMLPGIVCGLVIPRLMQTAALPRPEARFQPSDASWIISPGELTMIQRGRGGRWKSTRVAARGITRFDFMLMDPNGNPNGQLIGDHLAAKGTASELGLAAEKLILLPVHSGIDRELFARELTRKLSGSA